VLGSVKNTQNKQYKKLKMQLAGHDQPSGRKVSFDTSEEEKSSDNISLYKKKSESVQDFNQEIDN
jgi:hypothetical protein